MNVRFFHLAALASKRVSNKSLHLTTCVLACSLACLLVIACLLAFLLAFLLASMFTIVYSVISKVLYFKSVLGAGGEGRKEAFSKQKLAPLSGNNAFFCLFSFAEKKRHRRERSALRIGFSHTKCTSARPVKPLQGAPRNHF